MEKYELQKLRDLPIEGVAERLGLRVVRHKCLCPFHDDHHASLSFSVRRNTFRCFACDAPGERLFLQLQQLLPNLQHHQLPPDCKDFSEFYLATRRRRAP